MVTPSLDGSILSGITRMSSIELMKSWGLKVTEREISIDELAKAAGDGLLKEAFGTGTAAVISPIGELNYEGNVMRIHDGKIGPISQKLYDQLTEFSGEKLRIQWDGLLSLMHKQTVLPFV